MGVLTSIQRALTAVALTIFYNVLALLQIAFAYIRNPFKDPLALKLQLEPPACLSDPKYGVHKYIKANNIKLHYVESGDPSKPLMVFVHGFPEFWFSWHNQILEFQKDYWCVAIDMRGYGDSERPDGISSYKVQHLVEDLRDLVRQLGREKVILVSHDWGGLICCRYRDLYPDTLIALIMLASASLEAMHHEIWNNPGQLSKSWYMFFFQAPWIPERLLQMNDLEMIVKFFEVEGKPGILQQEINCLRYWFGKRHALTPAINYYRANMGVSIPEKPYSEEKVPFLVANAEKDIYIGFPILDRMKEAYACIETDIVKGCAHFLHQEDPQKVNKLIRDFLVKHKI